jgi:hypothetical protein
MNSASITLLSLVACGALVTGCSNAEPFDVTGEISSAETVSSPITLEFFEVDATDPAATRESIHVVTVSALGAVSETVEADPALTVVAQALVDTDDDGACTEGELWGETELVKKADGTFEPFVVDIKAQACPAAAE